MEWIIPATPEEASASIREDGVYLAGATALTNWDAVTRVIDIGELDYGVPLVSTDDCAVVISAGARLDDLLHHEVLRTHTPLLADLLPEVAGPAVRNSATIGGNVAGGAGCLLPILLALDAELEILTAGERVRQELTDYLAHRDPRALIVSVRIPPAWLGQCGFQEKVGYRHRFSPSVIGVAGRWTLDSLGRIERLRLAVGGGPNSPRRLTESEKQLRGQNPSALGDDGVVAILRDEIDTATDAFHTAGYRREVAAGLLAHHLCGNPKRGQLASTACAEPESLRRQAIAAAASNPDANCATPPMPPPVELSRASMPDRWHTRPDGREKAAASFRYLTDVRQADMLVAKLVRIPLAHAKIRSINTDRAATMRGVVAVLTADDIPGINAHGILVSDQPVFASDLVRSAGDAVAVVCAETESQATAAAAAVHVEFDPLPNIDSVDEAMAADAVKLHPGGNVHAERTYGHGDLASAWERCVTTYTAEYRTPRQAHAFMETEGGYANVEPDGSLAIFAGGQHGYRDRAAIAAVLAIPEESIRLVTSPIGGAFGGKDGLNVHPVLGLLALRTRRPVRLHFSRTESMIAGLKRMPMHIRMKTGCDGDGRIIAHDVDVTGDSGAYTNLTPSILQWALNHYVGPYRMPNAQVRGRCVFTTNGTSGAFRGFGANEMSWALEQQIDGLAMAAGRCPREFRRLNLRKATDSGNLGQDLAPSDRIAAVLDGAVSSPLWRTPPSADGRFVLGTGMALIMQGNGLGSANPDVGGGRFRLGSDGYIQAEFGAEEFGQGAVACIVNATSEALGCGRNDVRPIVGDTRRVPDTGSSTAARVTYVVWKAVQLASPTFRAALLERAAQLGGPGTWRIVPGGVRRDSDGASLSFSDLSGRGKPIEVSVHFSYPKSSQTNGNVAFFNVFGACVVQVRVDRLTGDIELLAAEQHAAAGPMIDAAGYLGQIEGGAAQALGFALTEHVPYRGGLPLKQNLDTFLIPTIADMPCSTTTFVYEQLDEGDPYGPRGVGELGVGTLAPAIANAVACATGIRLTNAPIEREQLLFSLRGKAAPQRPPQRG